MSRFLHTFATVRGEICDVLVIWHYQGGVEIDGIYDKETGERFHLITVSPHCIKRITDTIEARYFS